MATKAEFLAGLLKGLKGYVHKLEKSNNKGFNSNYNKLRSVGTEQPLDTAKLGLNEEKNRYRNVLPYDHSRIVISDGQTGDYINANYIPGFQNEKRYIATQGPVPPTIIDFWRMVWQEQVEVAIKVTREVESGVLKCHKYWPDPSGESPQKMALLGQVEVEHVSTEETAVFITRKFVLRRGETERTFTQFSYEAWPDHGVPVTTREFLDFRRACKVETDKTSHPIIVHCSAGVGRTGTYITVDRCLDAVASGKKSKDLDVDTTIKTMRMNRCFMVQTAPQYTFCYHALLDGIRELLRAEGSKTLSRADKSFVDKDLAAQDADQEQEDKEISAATKKKKKGASQFKALDLDGDGMLSLEEMLAVGLDEASFREMDKDGNGSIDKKEFRVWRKANPQAAKGLKLDAKIVPVPAAEQYEEPDGADAPAEAAPAPAAEPEPEPEPEAVPASVAATEAELKAAEQEWELAKDPEYDVRKALTSLESRYTALLQAGKEVEMTRATPDQIRAIVMAGKELDRKKREAAQAKKDELLARKQKVLQARERRKSVEKKADEKLAAQKKASKFLKKMG